jgi:uncharacterized protein YicC (UPF0701 family)
MQADKEFRKALSAILNQLQKEGKALTRTQKNMANTLRKSTKNVRTMVTPFKTKNKTKNKTKHKVSPKKKPSKK